MRSHRTYTVFDGSSSTHIHLDKPKMPSDIYRAFKLSLVSYDQSLATTPRTPPKEKARPSSSCCGPHSAYSQMRYESIWGTADTLQDGSKVAGGPRWNKPWLVLGLSVP